MLLSIIFPVCAYPDPKLSEGKPHPFLFESLDSILRGGITDFEVLVGIDGARPWVDAYLKYWCASRQISSDKVVVYQFPFSGSYGNRQRNSLMRLAKGDFLCFMDQDDAFVNGGLKTISSSVMENPVCPHLFRIVINMFGDHTKPAKIPILLWNDAAGRIIRRGCVGGHMFVVPNNQSFLSEWPETLYEADYHFIKNTCDSFKNRGIETVWRSEIIASIRPWAHFLAE